MSDVRNGTGVVVVSRVVFWLLLSTHGLFNKTTRSVALVFVCVLSTSTWLCVDFRHYISYGLRERRGRSFLRYRMYVRQSRVLSTPGWNVLKAGVCDARWVLFRPWRRSSGDAILYIYQQKSDVRLRTRGAIGAGYSEVNAASPSLREDCVII